MKKHMLTYSRICIILILAALVACALVGRGNMVIGYVLLAAASVSLFVWKIRFPVLISTGAVLYSGKTHMVSVLGATRILALRRTNIPTTVFSSSFLITFILCLSYSCMLGLELKSDFNDFFIVALGIGVLLIGAGKLGIGYVYKVR